MKVRISAAAELRRRRAAVVAVLALLGGVVGPGPLGSTPAGAAVTGVFHGAVSGFIASPAVVAPSSFQLSSSNGLVVPGGAWLSWSAASTRGTLVLDGPDSDTDGSGSDVDGDVLSFPYDARLDLPGGRSVFSARLPSSFPTTTVFTSDLAAGDQLAAVAVVEDGVSPRTFFHVERDLSSIAASGSSSTFTGLPKPTVASGSVLYGVIEASGAPTAGSSRFHSPDSSPTPTTFTAGTYGVEAAEVPVALDPAATTARAVLSGDADSSFVRLYSGVAYAAPAPALTSTTRFVATGTTTGVTSRNPGQSFDVLVSFANAAGAGPARGLRVDVPLPTSTTQSGAITEEGATGAGSSSGTGPVAISVAELLGGQTYSVRIPVVVDDVPGAGSTDEVSLAAQTVTYDDPSGASGLTTSTTADSLDVNPTADLTATLTAESASVVLSRGSAPLGYVLTLTNEGPDPVTAATYSLTKPPGTEDYVFGGTGLACSDDATTVTCSLPDDLPSGATTPPTTLRATATTTGTKTTVADRLSSAPLDTTPANDDSAPASVEVRPSASSVDLTGSAPATVTLGGGPGHDPYTASFSVANRGPDSTESASLSIPVPAGTAVTTAGCAVEAAAVTSGTITCGLGDIGAGQTRAVSLTVDPSEAGQVALTGTYSQTNDGSAAPASLTLSTTVRAVADVRVSVGATPNPVKNGEVLTYTVAAANAGPSAATGVQVTLALSPSVSFESLTAPSGWTCNAPSRGTTGTVVCDRAGFASGAVSHLQVRTVVGAAAKTSVSSTAGISGTSHDPTGANDTATVATAVKGGKK